MIKNANLTIFWAGDPITIQEHSTEFYFIIFISAKFRIKLSYLSVFSWKYLFRFFILEL